MTTQDRLATAPDLGFPAIWLRDNCPCQACRDQQSGQKLFGILDIARDVSLRSVEHLSDSVVVTFEPDGHRAELSRSWLGEQAGRGVFDGRTEQDKQLWQAGDLHARMPVSDWSRYSDNDGERLRVLRAVQQIGFALVRGAPLVQGTVLDIAKSFGYVRETNYGELFDVRVELTPSNLAFTGLEISPHTDNPYRDPVPTLQLLHCLSNAAEGGESGLLDGFEAAAVLRREDAGAFDTLARTLVPFAWSDGRASLRAERPLIGVDPLGRTREIRFNNRSMQPLRLGAADIEEFYAAYRLFAEVIARPELRLDFRLDAGDCVIFDNVRILHSRTAFQTTRSGRRHLQGCYADLDGLASTIAVLERSA